MIDETRSEIDIIDTLKFKNKTITDYLLHKMMQ